MPESADLTAPQGDRIQDSQAEGNSDGSEQDGRPAVRRVYRHSIVPGGTYSREEVRQAQSIWPRIQIHYASVNTSELHTERLESDLKAYVSYKKDGEIYWTSYQVDIPEGELVLTDGRNKIRARCGNRISEVPAAPTQPPECEPPPAELQQVEMNIEGQPPEIAGHFRFRHWIWPTMLWPPWGPKPPPDKPPGPVVPELPSATYLGLGLALAVAARFLFHRR